MQNDANCIFCRIVRGEIPSSRVYEDEHAFAFLDLNPFSEGHTLVVSKHHCSNVLDFPLEESSALMAVIQKVAAAVMKATGAEGFHVLQNNFPAAGQTVFHAHWHIIPRHEGDGLVLWKQGAYASPEAMQNLAAKISGMIA